MIKNQESKNSLRELISDILKSKKVLLFIVALFATPLLLELIVFLVTGGIMFFAGEVLVYYGSLVAFIGTVLLALVAWKQNEKLSNTNDRLIDFESKRENEKLFEMYFSFLDQTMKIFDANYILGDFTKQRQSIEMFFSINNSKLNALAIKRRLLFLDERNSGHEFFEYAMGKIEEISDITINYKDDGKELGSKILNFMQSNEKDFNMMALRFLTTIFKSIFEKSKALS